MIFKNFKPGCNKAIRKKLLSFGITPGIEVEFVRKAPLGDPIEIKVRGFFLSLRKEEFESLEFEKNQCTNCFKKCKI